MYHRTRWTPEKIKQRLELIAPLVYRKQKTLPSFRFYELNGPLMSPPVGANVDDSNWQEINTHEYWGSRMQDFVLRTTFTIPDDWDTSQPIALYWPLGEAGDFSLPKHWPILTASLTLNETELSVENDSINLNLRPYQIMTIRLRKRA